jgi:5-methylcytosine-specific restriction enzyme subunit McrC
LYEIRAKSYVGVIKLPSGTIIRITPKIGIINFFEVLKYVFDIKLIDYWKKEVPFKAGLTFIDLFALFFLNELKTIVQEGLYKSYVTEQENLNYVKGRILVPQTIRINSINKHRVYCEYDNLSFNNIENRSILFGSYLLTSLPLDSSISQSINEHIQMLTSQDVQLEMITKSRMDKIVVNKFNEYYEKIIDLTKLIVEYSFVEYLTAGESKAFSFLVNMNKIFELLVTKLVKESYPNLKIIDQSESKNLIRKEFGERDIIVKPDIEVRVGNNTLALIDAKYKDASQLHNSDVYQATAYSLAFGTNVILLYPVINGTVEASYLVLKNNKKIIVKTVDLKSDLKGIDYINHLKEELKERLRIEV